MADNTTKAPLNTKQKVIGALTVVIFGFIIYEVIGLFSSGETAAPAITPAAQTPTQQKQMSATMPATGNTTATTVAMQQQSAAASGTLASVNAITFPKENADIQKQQQQQQQSYLDSVNQLQLIKVKREIAENNQAIATARLATETANKTMSDLLTQPAVLPQPPGGLSATDNSGKPGTVQAVGQSPEGMSVPIASKSQVLDIPFTVISVSMQSNRWNAVLSYQDKLYSVSIGDSLFDGSKVVSISKNGVSLLKDGNKRKISIQTMI